MVEEATMGEIAFGFLQEPTVLSWSAGRIAPLADHAGIVEQLLTDERAHGGWFYPPLGPVAHDSSEEKEEPLVPKGFGLPATHSLLLTGEDRTDECANFFIALFGMLKGQRLQRNGWMHLYKAPIGRELCDFYAGDREIVQALGKATDFWLAHTDAEIRKLAFGALHWHLFAQLYEHEFEQFNAQYMALDACWKLALKLFPELYECPGGRLKKKEPSHAKRAGILCTHLGVPAPSWVLVSPGEKSCELATRRNALVHEAMYGGQPIGFAYPGDSGAMMLGLTCLVARIQLRLLGIDNEYTRSISTSRQMHGFAFTASP